MSTLRATKLSFANRAPSGAASRSDRSSAVGASGARALRRTDSPLRPTTGRTDSPLRPTTGATNATRPVRGASSNQARRLSALPNEEVVVDTTTAEGPAPTYEIELPRDQVQKGVVLGQIVKGGQPTIFVSAVGMGSVCEEAGVVPGQVLRALSHPTAKGEYWTITGGERLRYVRDAINTTRAGQVKLVLDKEQTVSAADVEAASEAVEDFEEVPSPELSTAELVPQEQRDRQDLYTDNWDGDQYKGSGWNELTVGLGLAVAVPILGLGFAAATYGTLWGTSGYAYLGF